MSRSCEGCTKCCEGFLSGEAESKKFYPGQPCHFVQIGKGCAIYAKRPKDPCVNYVCLWRKSDDVPAWMKPSEIDAIADERKTANGIGYVSLHEAGSPLDSGVLSWWIEWALQNGANLLWEVRSGRHYLGSTEFVTEMEAGSLAAM